MKSHVFHHAILHQPRWECRIVKPHKGPIGRVSLPIFTLNVREEGLSNPFSFACAHSAPHTPRIFKTAESGDLCAPGRLSMFPCDAVIHISNFCARCSWCSSELTKLTGLLTKCRIEMKTKTVQICIVVRWLSTRSFTSCRNHAQSTSQYFLQDARQHSSNLDAAASEQKDRI